MKIRKITISDQHQFLNVASSLSMTPRIELSAELTDGDDFEACAHELRLTVEAELSKHVAMIEDVALVKQKLREQEAAERVDVVWKNNTMFGPLQPPPWDEELKKRRGLVDALRGK